MCGICGTFGFVDGLLLRRMCKIISHRGPDEFGFYTDKNVGLGSRRLKIIDLKTGKQPIYNEDGSICVVFNGEIYNFKELRRELERVGHRFYTDSDTEVLVHSYEEFGENFVQKLEGQFAFAIYDSNKHLLYLARDQFGIIPLYYSIIEDKFIFASEIKAILEYWEITCELDLQALSDFLTYRYVPEPNTILKNVKKLLPAHYMVIKKNHFKINKYWDVMSSINLNYDFDGFGVMLSDTIKKSLVSDVPLGLYLSGGLDSSTILSFMREENEDVKTFSIGYGLNGFEDELSPAKMVAEYFNTDHHEFIIEEDIVKVLPKIVWYMDEPIGDPTAVPSYYLSTMAKRYVTVVLSGEGADELLGGYEQYKIMLLANKIPSLARKIIPTFLNMVPTKLLDYSFKYSSSLGAEGKKRFADFIYNFGVPYKDYYKLIAVFTEDEKKGLFSKEFNFISSDAVLEPYLKTLDLNNMLLADIKTFLLQLLAKTDKMSMANSVEARVPFLNPKLAEYAFSLPPEAKIKGFKDKYILRKTMSKKLPSFITNRKKQRFFVPVHLWIEQMLDSNIFENKLFKNDYIKRIINGYKTSKLYYGRQLWNLLIFNMWYKTYVGD